MTLRLALGLAFASISSVGVLASTGCSSNDNTRPPFLGTTSDGGAATVTGQSDASSQPASGGLTGTFDMTSTTGTGTAVISSAGFTITVDGSSLAYTVGSSGMSAVWTTGSETDNIAIARTASAGSVSGGVIPLDFGGNFTFTDVTALNLAMAPGTLSLHGQADGLPDFSPTPDPTDTYTGTRAASPAASIFGDLGGVWTLTDAKGSGTCTASFVGSTFSTNCSGTESTFDGTLSITFSADLNTASGTDSSGDELSAKRQ